MKTFQQFISEAYFHLDEERVPVRKRGGVSAPEGERSIGGVANRRNKDYWASVVGSNRDRGMGSEAKRRVDALKKKEFEIEEGVRPGNVEKPLDKAAFNKRRRSLDGKEKSAEARSRGHVGKEWYNSGRTYSPDEAKRGRAKIDDEERSTRHRSSIDPEGDDDNYSADKTKNPKKLRKQKAMGELGEEYIDEFFITRKSPEKRADDKRKKKVAELIRLMQHAKNPHSDVALKTAKTEEYIDETSLNRVRSKSEKGGMAIMSAQRGDKSKSENKERSKQLEKDIRGAGLPGPTKVSGRYTENPGTSQEKKVGEKSHVVSSGKMGKRKFKKAITKLGKKYNQDSVLIQKKPKGDAQLVGTNKSWPGEGKRVKVGKMNPGKTGEFDTKVKNKTFTYEN